MSNSNNQNNSLVPARSNALIKITDTLQITNKIIFGGVESLFNQAFYLINSKHLHGIEENFCFFLEYHSDYHKKKKFKFEANSNEDYKKAIDIFTQIIQIKPSLNIAFRYRGLAFIRLKNFSSAIDDCSKAIEINPNDAYAYLLLGNARVNVAIEDYRKVWETDPKLFIEYEDCHFGLDSSFQSAIIDFSKVIEIDPNFSSSYNNRAIVKTKLYSYSSKEVLADFDMAIQIDPDNYAIYFNRGNAKIKAGDFIGAIDDFNRAIEFKSDDPDVFNNRGIAKFKLGNFNEAIADYNISLKISSDKADVYNNRGVAKHAIKELISAIDDFNQAAEVDPNYSYAFYNRGNVRRELRDYDNAVFDYRKAVKIDDEKPIELSHPTYRSFVWQIYDYVNSINFEKEIFVAYDKLMNDFEGTIKAYEQTYQDDPEFLWWSESLTKSREYIMEV